ncbi:DUF2934 domain-containing protein [Accumulibacter sp.]|uniref:DUF2934 domain-containing protein n=1 Tax=Accumulibacter sp. TaxID=2053492 RepID=UPI001ACF973E|nr:DUF2934 domain-containing protein [Accumulibacter sp.]MBN8499153.1 DUF2934 domain-containing protein [Accumulibacter sp.]
MPSRRRPTLTLTDPVPQGAGAAIAAAADDVPPRAATHDDIARLAYLRAESRGFTPGLELEDWLWAEATLCAPLLGTPTDEDTKPG